MGQELRATIEGRPLSLVLLESVLLMLIGRSVIRAEDAAEALEDVASALEESADSEGSANLVPHILRTADSMRAAGRDRTAFRYLASGPQ